jgi:hypothetical protein
MKTRVSPGICGLGKPDYRSNEKITVRDRRGQLEIRQIEFIRGRKPTSED